MKIKLVITKFWFVLQGQVQSRLVAYMLVQVPINWYLTFLILLFALPYLEMTTQESHFTHSNLSFLFRIVHTFPLSHNCVRNIYQRQIIILIFSYRWQYLLCFNLFALHSAIVISIEQLFFWWCSWNGYFVDWRKKSLILRMRGRHTLQNWLCQIQIWVYKCPLSMSRGPLG